MIEAIIPVPNRLPLERVLDGTQINIHRASGTQLIGGRCIRIVPLIFYKVFSLWSGIRYEHTFVTDEPVNPVNLRTYERYDGKVVTDQTGSILFPVSVKRISTYGAATYLFTRSINFLLQHYHDNIPMSLMSGLDEVYWDNHSLTTTPCQGVHSYAEYQLHTFSPALNTLWSQWKLSDEYDLAVHTTTPENPSMINDCVDEICSSLNPDRLFDYIDDMAMYESNQHTSPDALVLPYVYTDFPPDPITQWCLMSPSYILGRQLMDYAASTYVMEKYLNMGYNPQDDEFTRSTCRDGDVRYADKLTMFDDLIELVGQLPDTHFQIKLTWDNVYPVITTVFGYERNVMSPVAKTYEYLYSLIRQKFLNKHVDPYAYDDVIISKSWADEIFISCKSHNKPPVNYYVNMAWYHLTSPSLINHQYFTV